MERRDDSLGGERRWQWAGDQAEREFFGCGLTSNPPDHFGPVEDALAAGVEAREAVFGRVLELLDDSGLLEGVGRTKAGRWEVLK